MPVLRLLSPDARQVLREFRIVSAETTIGRDRDNVVVLTDDSVSRHHARLLITVEACTIVDQDSANGVWVRGARVRSAPLWADDLFHVGDCLLQLVEDEAPPSAPAAMPPAGPAPRGKSQACGVAVLLLLVAGVGCGGGVMLYLIRDQWMPRLSGGGSSTSTSTDATPGPTTPPAQETPCPPPAARLCPWTYGTPTASECPPGFCWDGGPLGSASCKQQALVEHSYRTEWSDVFCDDGFTPVLSRCSNAIERCVAR
jgi:hypothetical protein